MLIRKALEWGLPPKGAHILAGAWEATAAALVTEDRQHFGHLYSERGVVPVRKALGDPPPRGPLLFTYPSTIRLSSLWSILA